MKAKIYRFATLLFSSFLMFSCASESVPLRTENKILSFTITKGHLSKNFDISGNSITGKVESKFELNDINLKVLISEGAVISPDPSTIKSITGSFTLAVKAENGDEKKYEVTINREPSIENSILEFNIKDKNLLTNVEINEQTGIITKRLPEFVDLKNLNINLKFSKYASISPEPGTIKDYSSPVIYTVKSESGVEKVYQVKFTHMDTDRFESCSEANAWKWFGGDDRTNAPDILPYDRNIGTGQAIVFDKDFVPSTFSIHLREGFKYSGANTDYRQDVVLKLIIRDASDKFIASTTANVLGNFSGGFVPFNLERLNVFLEAKKTYVFYWYLVNGEALGVVASSSGNNNDGSGFCFNSGYAGESKKSANNTLENVNVWYKHNWHFNIEIKGKE